MRKLTLPSVKLYRVALAIGAAILLWAGVSMLIDSHRSKTAPCMDVVLVVNDSTEAMCAKLRADQVELRALKEAAGKMRGDLVAGTKIIVKSDTITRAETTVVTMHAPDGTRTAALADTTDDYQIRIDATAPPTGNLKLGYSVVTPVRQIEVGFVKRVDGYYAVASGKGVHTAEAFFAPPKEKPLSLVVGGAVKGAPAANLAGATVRADLYGALQYHRNALDYQVRVGHDGSPYVALAVEKRIW